VFAAGNTVAKSYEHQIQKFRQKIQKARFQKNKQISHIKDMDKPWAFKQNKINKAKDRWKRKRNRFKNKIQWFKNKQDDGGDTPGDDNPDIPGDDNPDIPGDDNPDIPGDDNPDIPGDDNPDIPGSGTAG